MKLAIKFDETCPKQEKLVADFITALGAAKRSSVPKVGAPPVIKMIPNSEMEQEPTPEKMG